MVTNQVLSPIPPLSFFSSRRECVRPKKVKKSLGGVAMKTVLKYQKQHTCSQSTRQRADKSSRTSKWVPLTAKLCRFQNLLGYLPGTFKREDNYEERRRVSTSHHKLLHSTCSSENPEHRRETPKVSCFFHFFTVIILNMYPSRSIVSSLRCKHGISGSVEFGGGGERTVHINNFSPVSSHGHYLTQTSYIVPRQEIEVILLQKIITWYAQVVRKARE